MRIFMTGERGFIGSHLYRRLLADGHAVTTDMRDFENNNCDLVIHLAAKTHIRPEFDPELFNSNILFAKKIMSTPRRLIYASSCSAAYMTNPYAYTKRYNEYLGEIHGNAVGLRFHNVYGPGNNKGVIKFLMEQHDKSNVTIRGPKLVRDYIHVDNVVEFIVGHFIDSDHIGVVDVGSSLGTKTIDLVNLFQEVSGKKFVLNFEEHGNHEPEIMVSNTLVFHYSLAEGIKRTINEDAVR